MEESLVRAIERETERWVWYFSGPNYVWPAFEEDVGDAIEDESAMKAGLLNSKQYLIAIHQRATYIVANGEG